MEALGGQNEAARSCFLVSCVLLTECNVSSWQWWCPVISGDPVTPRGRPGPATSDPQISISKNHTTVKMLFNLSSELYEASVFTPCSFVSAV